MNENSAIRGALRRTFARSPLVREVLKSARRDVPRMKADGTRAKVDMVQYLCASCKKWVPSKGVAVDHITPVIDDTTGFVDWNTFVARLFCDKTNLQVLCPDCHKKKTNAERNRRSAAKDKNELSSIRFSLLFPCNEEQIKQIKKRLKAIAKKKDPEFSRVSREAADILTGMLK